MDNDNRIILENFNSAFLDALDENLIEEDFNSIKNALKKTAAGTLAGLSLATGLGVGNIANAKTTQPTNGIVLPTVPDSWKTPPIESIQSGKSKSSKLPDVPEQKDQTAIETTANKQSIDLNKFYEIARVIYSECGPNSSDKDVRLVCQVIMNRIGNRDFRNLTTKKVPTCAWDVIADSKSFNVYNNTTNSSWNEFEEIRNKVKADKKLTPAEKKAFRRISLIYGYAIKMMKNNTSFLNDLSDDEKKAVFFHDDTIGKPKSWTRADLIDTTGTSGKLIFYKLSE